MTDIKTINGIGPATAAVLAAKGIGSIAALAAVTDPASVLDTDHYTLERLNGWIEEAKAIMAKAPAGAPEPAKAPKARARYGKAGPGKGARSARAGHKGDHKRSVVLLVDEDGLGRRGAVVRVAPRQAEKLRAAGKARRATLDDFPSARSRA
ncbi:helix-hairpin-helix domain-containing protein [Pelagibacterium montanilacus]|uniref:helix-hairpin-helix domain-containing protein n=1 Tax=Pelagibacterium montanilacus TaxID=2185280 RepID=UPI000F8F4C44|nr:helix-hairpin-helix domain-containing protein [Pelagibacterium montanilacus]